MRQNIYDDKNFFNDYKNMRRNERKGISANDLIEIPTIRSMMPNFVGKKVLDLGCGYGENCKYALDNGALYVLGTDISKRMIDVAKEEVVDEKIDFDVMAMEDISKINKKFDIVISSLAIHYVKDFDKLCKDVYNLLNDDGYFVFSQEHPLNTCPILNEECGGENKVELGGKRYYLISDYNNEGVRINNWNNCKVLKYHRNFSSIINSLVKNKFKILEIKEPIPTDDIIIQVPKYKYQYDRPYFIFIKVRKG